MTHSLDPVDQSSVPADDGSPVPEDDREPLNAAPLGDADLEPGETIDEDTTLDALNDATRVPDAGSEASEPAAAEAPGAADAAPGAGPEPPAVPDEPVAEVVDQSADVAQLSADLEAAAARLAAAELRSDELASVANRNSELVDRLHSENQKLREGEIRQALGPIINGLSRIANDVDRMRDPDGELSADLTFIAGRIAEVLHDAGVRPIEPSVGGPFDSSQHHAVGAADAPDAESDRTIAEVRRTGLAQDDGRVLRAADVVVYRYAPAPAPAPEAPTAEASAAEAPATETPTEELST